MQGFMGKYQNIIHMWWYTANEQRESSRIMGDDVSNIGQIQSDWSSCMAVLRNMTCFGKNHAGNICNLDKQ